jgi:hypothetical protein
VFLEDGLRTRSSTGVDTAVPVGKGPFPARLRDVLWSPMLQRHSRSEPDAGKIDENLVRHIAMLSRSSFEAEVRLFSEQLSAIVAYMDKLNEVDTSDVPPTPRLR